MLITILRHGEASMAATDQARELTAVGRSDVARGSAQLQHHCQKRQLPSPELALYSDWTRTRQTADIVAGELQLPIEALDTLRPHSNELSATDSITQLMQDSPQLQHLLLVSHQPLVSELIDYLLGSQGEVPGLLPGGMATLELDVAAKACASLLFWALPPSYEASV